MQYKKYGKHIHLMYNFIHLKNMHFLFFNSCSLLPLHCTELASVGILEKEREPGVGKLGWHGNFDTGFESNVFQNPVCGFFELF